MTTDLTYGDVYIWGCNAENLLEKYDISYARNARQVAHKYFLWEGGCPTCFAVFISNTPLEEILELVEQYPDKFSGFTVASEGSIYVLREYQKRLVQLAGLITLQPFSSWLFDLAYKQAPFRVQLAS